MSVNKSKSFKNFQRTDAILTARESVSGPRTHAQATVDVLTTRRFGFLWLKRETITTTINIAKEFTGNWTPWDEDVTFTSSDIVRLRVLQRSFDARCGA